MPVLKPTYNMNHIAPETKDMLCHKIAEYLTRGALEELEQEKKSKTADYADGQSHGE